MTGAFESAHEAAKRGEENGPYSRIMPAMHGGQTLGVKLCIKLGNHEHRGFCEFCEVEQSIHECKIDKNICKDFLELMI